MSSQKITTLPSLQALISQMKSSSSLSSRQALVNQLLQMKDSLYPDFVHNKGINILSRWIHGYKENFENGSTLTTEEESLISDIIQICDRCDLTFSDMKNSKIGKNINKLSKALKSGKIQIICQDIVSKWKEMCKNHSNNNNDDEYLSRKTKRESTNIIINNNNNINITMNAGFKNNVVIGSFANGNKKLKSCLKGKNAPKSRPNVRFENENLEKVKIFKKTDEPNAPNISHEEYLKIQQEVALNPHIFKNEDIRMKDIKMDKPKTPAIKWREPLKLSIESNVAYGKNSKEKGVIDDLCKKVLSVTYFGNNIQEPKDGESKLFAFEDHNIPKVENSKIATKASSLSKNNFVSFIENFLESHHDKEITEENIEEIKGVIENIKDIPNEQKNSLIAEITSRIKPQNKPQNPIPPQPIFGPNLLLQPRPQLPINFVPPVQLKPGIDQRMFMESASRMNIAKYKTKPCRNYHTSIGCSRGDNCFFIHDTRYVGVPIPNFNLADYEKKLPIIQAPFPQMALPLQPPPMPQPKEGEEGSTSLTDNANNEIAGINGQNQGNIPPGGIGMQSSMRMVPQRGLMMSPGMVMMMRQPLLYNMGGFRQQMMGMGMNPIPGFVPPQQSQPEQLNK